MTGTSQSKQIQSTMLSARATVSGEKRRGWSDDAKGYFTSLRGAIKFIREQIIAETLKEGVRPLDEALRVMREIDERFVKILEEATHENSGRV